MNNCPFCGSTNVGLSYNKHSIEHEIIMICYSDLAHVARFANPRKALGCR